MTTETTVTHRHDLGITISVGDLNVRRVEYGLWPA